MRRENFLLLHILEQSVRSFIQHGVLIGGYSVSAAASSSRFSFGYERLRFMPDPEAAGSSFLVSPAGGISTCDAEMPAGRRLGG